MGLEVDAAAGVSLSLLPVFELRLVRDGKTTCQVKRRAEVGMKRDKAEHEIYANKINSNFTNNCQICECTDCYLDYAMASHTWGCDAPLLSSIT